MYALASETQEEIYDISHTHSSLFGRWEKREKRMWNLEMVKMVIRFLHSPCPLASF